MTYEESYEKCKTLEDLEEMARADIIIAGIIGNVDRYKVIKKAVEKVANKKFNKENFKLEE